MSELYGYTIAQLVAIYVRQLRERHGATALGVEDALGILLTVDLCHQLGQLLVHEDSERRLRGFIAFFRCAREHIAVVKSRDLGAIAALGLDELTRAPVCVVAEVLALSPGWAYKTLRKLRHAPGIEAWAGWRNLTRWKVQEVWRDGINRQAKQPSGSRGPKRAAGRLVAV